jgi:hypothetical protein
MLIFSPLSIYNNVPRVNRAAISGVLGLATREAFMVLHGFGISSFAMPIVVLRSLLIEINPALC